MAANGSVLSPAPKLRVSRVRCSLLVMLRSSNSSSIEGAGLLAHTYSDTLPTYLLSQSATMGPSTPLSRSALVYAVYALPRPSKSATRSPVESSASDGLLATRHRASNDDTADGANA